MAEKPPLSSFLKSPIQQEDLEPTPTPEAVLKTLRGQRGEKGDAPTVEELEALILPLIPDPIVGEKGRDGKDGKSVEINELLPLIENLIPAPVMPSIEDIEAIVLHLIPEPTVVPELQPKDLIEKINKAKIAKIKRERVEGFDEIEGLAKSANRNVQNILSLGGSRQTAIKVSGTLLGTGINTINFVGATGTKIGDGSEVNVSTGGGTGTVNSVVAGTGINVDNTDPANPIVSATGGGGSGYQAPLTGGLTGTNTWTIAPKALVIDGVVKQKTQTDGTVMWTGTTTTVLTGAQFPTFDIFAIG